MSNNGKSDNGIVCASIGSVSHATLRSIDLFNAFYHELEYQLSRQDAPEARSELKDIRELFDELTDEAFDENGDAIEGDDLEYYLNERLYDALDKFAPPYCYFGAHPGNGSDFGYWPCNECIDELPKFADLDEVPDDQDDDFAIVNDHGNVTIYAVTKAYKVVAEFV